MVTLLAVVQEEAGLALELDHGMLVEVPAAWVRLAVGTSLRTCFLVAAWLGPCVEASMA